MESTMRTKLLGGAAALMLTACGFVASASPAAAQPWVGPAYAPGGLVAAAASPLWAPNGYYDYVPGYAYAPAPAIVPLAPGPVVGRGGSVAYCAARFRSYDPATGMYLGYDGLHHPCP
jgi:hypothetical protein